jgi:hypothetical protein
MIVCLLKALEAHVFAVETAKGSEVLAALLVFDCILLCQFLPAITFDASVAVGVRQMLDCSLPVGVSLFANVADVGV